MLSFQWYQYWLKYYIPKSSYTSNSLDFWSNIYDIPHQKLVILKPLIPSRYLCPVCLKTFGITWEMGRTNMNPGPGMENPLMLGGAKHIQLICAFEWLETLQCQHAIQVSLRWVFLGVPNCCRFGKLAARYLAKEAGWEWHDNHPNPQTHGAHTYTHMQIYCPKYMLCWKFLNIICPHKYARYTSP